MKITEITTPTAVRVIGNTAPEINERIRRQMEERVRNCAASGADAIDQRLTHLEQEWDVERVLEAEAASTALLGLALGAAINRRFYAVTIVAAGMLLTHALHGWYPLLPLFRRQGLRTQEEIRAEKNALKALRGDFSGDSGRAAIEVLAGVQR